MLVTSYFLFQNCRICKYNHFGTNSIQIHQRIVKLLHFLWFWRFRAISLKSQLGVGLAQNPIESLRITLGSQNKYHRNRNFIYYNICENWRFSTLFYGDTVIFLRQSRVRWKFLDLSPSGKIHNILYIDHKYSVFLLEFVNQYGMH